MSIRIYTSRLLILLVLLPLFGCGANDTNRDQQRAQVREEIEIRRAELKPLVGEYEGELFEERLGLNRPFRVIITMSGQNYEGDKIPDETASPTLRATIQYFAQSDNGFYVNFKFTKSDIDIDNKKLWFYSSDPNATLEIDFEENTLTGQWSVDSRGVMGNFTAVKVK